MTNHPTIAKRPTADISPRKVALIAGIGLLFIALLSPFARFGVLQSLVVPADATATVDRSPPPRGSFVSALRPS
jgi:hypothetical protein